MKTDYSKFYISMVIILSILLIVTTIHNFYQMQEHLDKDLKFTKEITEFVIYEAEIIRYCANMSNISSDELVSNFLEYKASEIIKDTFNNGNGMEYDAEDLMMWNYKDNIFLNQKFHNVTIIKSYDMYGRCYTTNNTLRINIVVVDKDKTTIPECVFDMNSAVEVKNG